MLLSTFYSILLQAVSLVQL